MSVQNKIICITGKNQYSIDFVNYILTVVPKKNILILPIKNDNGKDTGPIIDKLKFKIYKNSNAYQNYLNLMKNSVTLLKKNFKNLIICSYNSRKQLLNKGSYYSKSSVNYKVMKFFNLKKISLKDFNKIKAFIFPLFQLPILNNKKLKSIFYINKKYKCIYD